MNDNTEYHIYVGLRDSQFGGEIVTENELREMIAHFFSQKNISFSMYSAKGGYLHEDGRFVSENTLCINLIGAYDLDILTADQQEVSILYRWRDELRERSANVSCKSI